MDSGLGFRIPDSRLRPSRGADPDSGLGFWILVFAEAPLWLLGADLDSGSGFWIWAFRGTFAISDENAESGIQIQSPDGRPQGHLDQLRQGVKGGGRVQNLSTEYRFFAYRSLLQGVVLVAWPV